jgi:ABC-type polysaccharide/polyol phosphate export permease
MKLTEVLNKRHESEPTNFGFQAGLLNGIINAIYALAIIFYFKDAHIQSLEMAIRNSPITSQTPIGPLYFVAALVAPIALTFLLAIAGMFVALFFNKFNLTDNPLAILICLGVGVLWGTGLNFPVESIKKLNIFVGTISWMVFYVVLQLRLKTSDQKDSNAA